MFVRFLQVRECVSQPINSITLPWNVTRQNIAHATVHGTESWPKRTTRCVYIENPCNLWPKKVITWRPNPDSVASSYWTQTQKSREKIFNYRATKEQTSWKKWCFSDIMPFSTRRRLCPAPPIAVVVLESNPPFRAMPTPRTTTMAVILENDTASTTTMYFEGFYPSSAYTAEPVSRGCLIGRAWHDIG